MDYFLTRMCLQKGLAFIYFIAFLIVLNQYRALLGEKGILPVSRIIKDSRFLDRPSLFLAYSSDKFLQSMGWFGLSLSIFAFFGFSEQYGFLVSMVTWFLLWAIYQSFVNIGQIFYGYGWEILLLEAGFLAIFLGAADTAPSVIVIWLYRWLLFRVMFGAGLIKIRYDRCWKDLSGMVFFYETQPLPGPLSAVFHRLPVFIHKFSVLGNHFIELIVPFFFFWPAEGAVIAGLLTFFFQSILVVSGNFSWLNCITMVLCFSCFNDAFLSFILAISVSKELPAVGAWHGILAMFLLGLISYLSIRPIKNLLSPTQAMNRNFDPFNLVNTYGAFGTITRIRNEIIIEGTSDLMISAETKWIPYEFKGKPGSIMRIPSQVSPYHYKIDWQMWFAAMSTAHQNPWFISFIEKLLRGEERVIGLLKTNPFIDSPPAFIRAELYEYHYAPSKDPTGAFWTRKWVREYLPPSKLIHPETCQES